MLSLGATFAADDVADVIAIDDEVTMDEPLAIEQDVQEVSANESAVASDVVTKDTFSNYFDSNGTLLSNVTSEELKFSGDIADVGVNTIVLDRAIKVVGENSTITDIAIDVKASDVVITGLTINQNNGTAAININNASNVQIEDTKINFNANAGSNGYAVNAELADNLKLLNNAITYAGATTGWEINNGLRVASSNGAVISGNKFNLSLISSSVGWAQDSTGNWVSSPISEGILIDSSNDVELADNTIDSSYNSVVGEYDTIYTIRASNSDRVSISNNNITASGHTYMYAIQISGEDFLIDGNTIVSESDNYYANGIDVEGPAKGTISNNVIDVKADQSVYAIYSGMNGQNVTNVITGNVITGDSYNAFGLSLGDVETTVSSNNITLKGNYTTGIASVVKNLIVSDNNVILNSSEEGNLSIWENFGVESVAIKVAKGDALIENNDVSAQGKGISIANGNVEVKGNEIALDGHDDADAYAIYAKDLETLKVTDNTVQYSGKTKGSGINNAVYVNNATGAIISGNNFNLSLVSSYVPWFEIPTGSNNWVSFPVSEGIVIDSSDDVELTDNAVDVTYNDVIGDYDTVYAVSFKTSNNANIKNNNITALGHTYIYGIQANGDKLTIEGNVISIESDVYYANGIDIEGPATATVKNNEITAKAVQSAYPIYSGMNGQNVSAVYENNNITGDAYLVIALSLGDVESEINNNDIVATGNYTTGIAYRGTKLVVDNNKIVSDGSNVGDLSIWESFGTDTAGIKIAAGESTITNNNITTTANYAIDAKNTAALVHDNYLAGKKFTGDESGDNADNATVYNNTPVIENKTATVVTITGVNGDRSVSGIVTDENGTPLSNNEVICSVDGVNTTVKTDSEGKFVAPAANGKVDIIFAEDSYYLASNDTITLTDVNPTKKDLPSLTVIAPADLVVGESTNAVISVPGATGNVTVIYDGAASQVTIADDGNAVFTIDKLTEGQHSIVAIYEGSEDYNCIYNSTSFKAELTATQFVNLTVSGDLTISGVLVDSLGNAVTNATILYSVDGVNTTIVSADGSFEFVGKNNAVVSISYDGNSNYSAANIDITLKDIAPVRLASQFNITEGKSIETYAVDYGAGERGQVFKFKLTDSNGKPIANASVQFAYKTVIFNRTTDKDGIVSLGVSTQFAGDYLCALSYLGDETHNATFVAFNFKLAKKTITISAAAKSFKKSTKTKKYTVTLKTKKFASNDGKTYLKSGKKVTLKVNGKTYTGKTNAKGQVTFKITNLNKKGKFTAVIKYAGDNTYNSVSKKATITVK